MNLVCIQARTADTAIRRFGVGDEVRLVKNEIPPGATGVSDYSIIDFERKPPLLWLTIAFAALVILFGRVRGALSLGLSSLDVAPASRRPALVTARAQKRGAIAHDDVSVVAASSA